MVFPTHPSSPASLEMRPDSAWRRHCTGGLAAALLLLCFWLLLITGLAGKSLTTDELPHVTAGYTYWKYNDYRMNPENGNLPQRIMALPLLHGFPFPSVDSEWWRASDVSRLGYQWLFENGNNASALILRGRMVMGLVAAGLGALVWAWSRRLFGPVGGMLSLLLYILNPTILAHGGLMTSDLTCALFLLASAWTLGALLREITPGRLVAGGLCLGALFVSKMSAALIVPVALILVALRVGAGRPLPLAWGRRRIILSARLPQALALVAALLVQGLMAIAVIWACYGFRYEAVGRVRAGHDHFSLSWAAVLDKADLNEVLNQLKLTPEQGAAAGKILEARDVRSSTWLPATVAAMEDIERSVLTPVQRQLSTALREAPPAGKIPRILDCLNRHHALPEAYLFGHAHAWLFAQHRGAFLNGRFSTTGWKTFFPYTFMVKTPVSVFVLMALALAAFLRRRPAGFPGGPWLETAGPVVVLLATYWTTAIFSHLNIGHRHILATYPPLFVLGGAAGCWLEALLQPSGAEVRRGFRFMGIVTSAALLALGGETVLRFPDYLPYFNGIVSPARGYRHLTDSSLDWGQDLPALKRYLDALPPAQAAYVSYNGSSSLDYYGIHARRLYSLSMWSQPLEPVRVVEIPLPAPRRAIAALPGQHPDYELIDVKPSAGRVRATLLLKPEALRLFPGIYCISASEIQPALYTPDGPWGPWNARFEAIYQELAGAVKSLSDARTVGTVALHTPAEWQALVARFELFRFARLTAWLRQREPDDTIHFSILVYKLTAADLHAALEGPPPELGPDLAASNEAAL